MVLEFAHDHHNIGADGGLAEYMVVDAKNARKVPRDLSLELIGMHSFVNLFYKEWQARIFLSALTISL